MTAGTQPTRTSARALLRFLGSVALVSGSLLLVDVGVTLLWQEPVSAFIAAREQDALEQDLADRARVFASTMPVQGSERPTAEGSVPTTAAAATEYARGLEPGRAFGRIELPTLGDSYVIVEGTDPATLRKGPGHYPGSGLPGRRRTVAVAGHRTTYGAPFGDLGELDRGDSIIVTMPYGRFTYRVRERRIVAPDALWVTERGTHRLVLTTCHPPFSAAKRLVVFADLVSESR
jgi:sortase A